MAEHVRCGHCNTFRRRTATEYAKQPPFFCDDICRERFDTEGVLMKCPCGCGRTFGSRQGFGMFASEDCAAAYAPVAARQQIDAWRKTSGSAPVPR